MQIILSYYTSDSFVKLKKIKLIWQIFNFLARNLNFKVPLAGKFFPIVNNGEKKELKHYD